MTAMIKPNELDNISLKIALEKSIYASAKCIKELDKPIMKNLLYNLSKWTSYCSNKFGKQKFYICFL